VKLVLTQTTRIAANITIIGMVLHTFRC
jgi:hypothetical protein